jgi:starvation-inducible outer membrane lipoprotein
MRRLLVLSTSLLLAACATAPKPTQVPVQPVQAPHVRSAIIGLTAAELVQRFGAPALQIREGESLKLQFRNAQCVLDAYLYPSGQAPQRVTHVDTRTRALAAIDQAFCIRSFEAP